MSALQPRPLYRLDQQVVRAAALCTPQCGGPSGRPGCAGRIFQHQEGRAVGLGRLGAHVEQVFARGLGEHGGESPVRLNSRLPTDRASSSCGPAGEFQPAHPRAGKALFQHALLRLRMTRLTADFW